MKTNLKDVTQRFKFFYSLISIYTFWLLFDLPNFENEKTIGIGYNLN